jgi:hypothetical protein
MISASHVAFGSTRVMATCAHTAQAVGLAAAVCRRQHVIPSALIDPPRMLQLQRALLRTGHHIPGVTLQDDADLAPQAEITASSELQLRALKADGPLLSLANGWAILLPVTPGTRLELTVFADVSRPAELRVELRQSSRALNHTPDVTLERQTIALREGNEQPVAINFAHTFDDARYAFVCFFGESWVQLRTSEQRLTGVLSLCHQVNLAVAKSAVQAPPQDIGVDTFEFWQPQRRPGGRNIAFTLATPLSVFGAGNVINGIARPTHQPNAWLAEFGDPAPTLTLRWTEPQTIARIELMFDPDYDHPMESVLMGHPERRMPFCVERYRMLDDCGRVIAACSDNHQARNIINLVPPITTRRLRIELTAGAPNVPAALFEVRCYAPD